MAQGLLLLHTYIDHTTFCSHLSASKSGPALLQQSDSLFAGVFFVGKLILLLAALRPGSSTISPRPLSNSAGSISGSKASPLLLPHGYGQMPPLQLFFPTSLPASSQSNLEAVVPPSFLGLAFLDLEWHHPSLLNLLQPRGKGYIDISRVSKNTCISTQCTAPATKI